jgi:hypothetical protein
MRYLESISNLEDVRAALAQSQVHLFEAEYLRGKKRKRPCCKRDLIRKCKGEDRTRMVFHLDKAEFLLDKCGKVKGFERTSQASCSRPEGMVGIQREGARTCDFEMEWDGKCRFLESVSGFEDVRVALAQIDVHIFEVEYLRGKIKKRRPCCITMKKEDTERMGFHLEKAGDLLEKCGKVKGLE